MKMKKKRFFSTTNLKTKDFYYFIILLIIPCFFFCAGLTGCSKVEVGSDETGTGTGAAGQPFGIEVTVQDPNIGLGEVIPVTATVTDSEGAPVGAGFQIDFSITPDTLGMFTPNDYGTTSNSGIALIYLFTLTPGNGVITAQFSGTGAWGALTIDIVGDPNASVDPNSLILPPISGTGIIGSITISKGANSIVADGISYVSISARVTDTAGVPMPDNTSVRFTTTGGDINPFSAGVQNTVDVFTENGNGVAQTTLLSSTNVGTVTIIASCSGFNTSDIVEFLPGPSATLTVEAFPDLLIPDGKSTSTIIVTVLDVNDNPVSDGTVLTFSADFGELSTLLATTSKGVATVTYTTPDSSPLGGTDTITVEAPNEQTGSVIIDLSGISGDPNAPIVATGIIGSITISKGAGSIVADGVSYVSISAQVNDTAGVPMPDNTLVTFTTTGGDIDPNVGVQSTVDVFTQNGVAQTTLTSSTNVGRVTIIASCSGFNTDDTVEFLPGPSATLTVEAFPDLLFPDGENTSIIMVTVLDVNDNPVGDGTVLTFSADFGELSTLLATTSKGVATVIYTTPDFSPPGGTDTITVEAPNEQTGNVVINLSGISGDPNTPTYPVGSITVRAGSQKILADGSTSVAISAEVKDTIGVGMPDGTAVIFTTTAGDFDPNTAVIESTITTSTSNGIARIRLTSSTKTGIATITAESGGFNNDTSVEFIPGPPATVIVEASPADLVADGLNQSIITVTVYDAHDNPVSDGTLLTFDTTDGELSSILKTTSVGVSMITYTVPGYVPAGGTDTVTAITTNEILGSAVINLSGAQVASITLSAEPESLPADGSSKSNITAAVTIIGGGIAPDDTPVDFTIISGGGTFQLTGTKTVRCNTAGGNAIARLISDPNVGTATIQATSGGITEEIQISYMPGSVTLTITPNSLLGTGEETGTIIVTLTDADGNPADNGEKVVFTLSDGTLGSLVDPNGYDPDGRPYAFSSGDQGQARVIFQASQNDGSITINATWSPKGIDITGSVTAIILPSPADIRIADGFPDPMSISIKGTGGTATSRLTFDVTDAHGDSVPDGYRIDFVIQSGPNGGEIIVPITARTENGQVTTLLRSGTKAGPVSIKAYYYYNSEVTTTASSVAISAGPPVGEEFSISAQYLNVSGFWYDGISDQIEIHAGDISGNPVPDDTAISFKTYNTGGSMVPGSSETQNGVAKSSLESCDPAPLQGFVSATAEATNGGRTTHVTSIAVTPSPDNSVIYAGTDGGGVYKSTDGGYSWETVSRSSKIPGQNWIDPYVNDISIDPDNHNTIYAATGYLGKGNVYRSFDGGLSWNSDDPEEWDGLLKPNITEDNLTLAVRTVLCDDAGSPYVWIGTEGLGARYASNGEDFVWGGLVDPSVVNGTDLDPNGNYIFDGTKCFMTVPTLSYSSKTERWRVTYHKRDAILNHNPYELDVSAYDLYLKGSPSGSNADGYMDGMTADLPADTETWRVTYTGGFDPDDPSHDTNLPNGELYVISTSATTKSETWTVTYRDPNSGWSQGGFYVFGTKSGGEMYTDLMQNYKSRNNEVEFSIFQTGPFVEGDTFKFTTIKDGWEVSGTYSGDLSEPAKTDVPYTEGGLEFLINSGETFYKMGDYFEFKTISIGNWEVEGTKSGPQNSVAENNILYKSDRGEVTFKIVLIGSALEEGDQFVFDVTESGLGYGRTVLDIVKVPDTHEDTAHLYAATGTGVFESTNGGVLWTETTSFTGDRITTLEMHPEFTDTNVIYAGTEDNGVWVTEDGCATWSKEYDGLGGGLGATKPLPDPGNKGNGAITEVSVDPNVRSETWSVTCETAATDGGVFSVTGSQSGPQTDATVGLLYTSGNGAISFTIYDGTFDFEVGDTFTFDTVRDPGSMIKDLLVDSVNNKLYAITYFQGALVPHAVGSVYVHDLEADGSFSPGGEWRKTNQNLPQYDPPDDTTLFAQHCLAVDDPADPGVVYIGGEGINLLRAKGDLASGNLAWESSKSGLTNLIMARMPVLFSGECPMDIRENRISGNHVVFTVYIQDENGNPPVAGSTFVVKHKTPSSDHTLLDLTYHDGYTHRGVFRNGTFQRGTFRDPSDASTNNPYIFEVVVFSEHEVEFKYTPSETFPDPPGTSGGYETVTFTY